MWFSVVVRNTFFIRFNFYFIRNMNINFGVRKRINNVRKHSNATKISDLSFNFNILCFLMKFDETVVLMNYIELNDGY